MKKMILIVLIAISFAFNASAQKASTTTLSAGDTVVNTAAVSKVIPVLTAGYEGAVVFANVTKISGTVGGTVQLFGSLDGTNYVQIGADQTATNTAGTKSYAFYVTAPVPVYLKVTHTGTGTMSSSITVSYVYRKHD